VGVLEATFVVCAGVQTTLRTEAPAGATKVDVVNSNRFCGAAESENNVVTIGEGVEAEQASLKYFPGKSDEMILSAPLARTHLAGEAVTHMARPVTAPIPVYELEPSTGHIATLGVSVLVARMLIQIGLSSPEGDSLTATLSGISTLVPIIGAKLTLWGIPSAPANDALRCNQFETTCELSDPGPGRAFMTNPTSCGSPPHASTMDATSYEGAASQTNASVTPVVGCERLHGAPTVNVEAADHALGAPSEYVIEVSNPEVSEPTVPATPPLERIAVTLPEGTSLSPGIGNGLEGCTVVAWHAQHCPARSQVGTAEVTTPVLPSPLRGAIYAGMPSTVQPFPILVVVEGRGVVVQVEGELALNPTTGRVVATFGKLPEVPLTGMKLALSGGPAAPLANPETCGVATAVAALKSYSGEMTTSMTSFVVTGPPQAIVGACDATRFDPTLTAGVTAPRAATATELVIGLSRQAGERWFEGLSVKLPPGLVSVLRGVPECSEALALSQECPATSEIGVAEVAAGTGRDPLVISGPVYLTGPQEGAPFGIAVTMNAEAGPYQLGVITIQGGIEVSARKAQLTIATAGLPTVMDGVPLRIGKLQLRIDRPNFVITPTHCGASTIRVVARGYGGVEQEDRAPFRLTGCAETPFDPRVRGTMSGPRSRAVGTSVSLKVANAPHAVNLRGLSITLPQILRARLGTVQMACWEPNFSVVGQECPGASRIGTIVADTPLLPVPLRGPLHLVADGGIFPTLSADLRGAGVQLVVGGEVHIGASGLITASFKGLPDVPVTQLSVVLPAGSHSAFGSAASLCGARPRLRIQLTGQNDAVRRDAIVPDVTGCGATRRSARRVGNARAESPRGLLSHRR
jgi:hypothetical protein